MGLNKTLRILAAGMIMILAASQSSCRVGYSFTGASVSPLVKTINIHNFPNNAALVIPTLSRDFTEQLRSYFETQTSLSIIEGNGDLDLDGAITGYNISPQAIQGNETAAMNRLTITVHVKFVNKIDDKQSFETDFSKYYDYASTPEPSPSQLAALIAVVNEQLVLEIFNKSLANW